jgi:hypothetical protein
MKTETPTEIQPAESGNTPGFFTRILGRIDQAMKQAAEKKASQGCCCCSGESKKDGDGGGKCC